MLIRSKSYLLRFFEVKIPHHRLIQQFKFIIICVGSFKSFTHIENANYNRNPIILALVPNGPSG